VDVLKVNVRSLAIRRKCLRRKELELVLPDREFAFAKVSTPKSLRRKELEREARSKGGRGIVGRVSNLS
jgi:hypothetical protein